MKKTADLKNTSGKLLLEQREHTAILTLNNPPAHTWTPESLNELNTIVEHLNADSSNRALVITGKGEKFFSAGADLNQFDHDDNQRCKNFADAFNTAFSSLTEYRGVSIAAINGYAMGGGLELALSCDIRVAEQHAVMALPECGVGLLPCGLGTQQLTQLIGEQWAKRMILLGEKIDAKKALALGLISEVVESTQSLSHAQALCDKLSQQSPDAVEKCKKLIMGTRNNAMGTMLKKENQAFVELFSSANRKEGVSAFLQKRRPDWKEA